MVGASSKFKLFIGLFGQLVCYPRSGICSFRNMLVAF